MLVEMCIVYLCELKLLFRRAKSTGGMRNGVVDDCRSSSSSIMAREKEEED